MDFNAGEMAAKALFLGYRILILCLLEKLSLYFIIIPGKGHYKG